MAGRDDAIALIAEIDALVSPNTLAVVRSQLTDRSKPQVYPAVLSPGSEPSYYVVTNPTDQQKADKIAFEFFLTQYANRKDGN